MYFAVYITQFMNTFSIQTFKRSVAQNGKVLNKRSIEHRLQINMFSWQQYGIKKRMECTTAEYKRRPFSRHTGLRKYLFCTTFNLRMRTNKNRPQKFPLISSKIRSMDFVCSKENVQNIKVSKPKYTRNTI